MLQLNDIDFSGFVGREEGLKKIGRYYIYVPMFYRPSVYFHSRKLFCLLKQALFDIQNKLDKNFDFDRTLIMALVHDDAEMIIGDIQASFRPKMSQAELKNADQAEIAATESLAKKFPQKINGYNYQELLLEIFKRNTLASQVVKYLDHLDAHNEALHELYAGNTAFTINIINEYGKLPLPTEFYPPRFNNYKDFYPLLANIIGERVPFLKNFEKVNHQKIAENGRPHTKESIKNNTGDPIYDWWKKTIIDGLGEEAIQELTTIKES